MKTTRRNLLRDVAFAICVSALLCAHGRSQTASGPGRLINLSILTSLSTTDRGFTMGFVVGGAGTSGAKPILIRAAGPSLTQLGVIGSLEDPKLELFAGSIKAGENDNWGGTPTLSNAMSSVGAFAYVSNNSRDSAILANITTSNNSAIVTSANNGTGLVIAELYDSSPPAGYTLTTPRLVNVSVLKHLGTGLIAGFVVGGATSTTVLVRAIGPTLSAAPFSVSGVVTDPQLALFSGSTQIGVNDNWSGTAALTAAFIEVGAFALPATSRDAALVATLAPGNYSVQVSGVGGTTGIALVEVYEVPPPPPPPTPTPTLTSPQIRTVTTTEFWRDRTYVDDRFRFSGTNLNSVSAIAVTPNVGVRTRVRGPSDGDFRGFLQVSANAATGVRYVTVSSPSEGSNPLPISVVDAPASAPLISNLVLDEPVVSGSNVTYRGRFNFSDRDGDVRLGQGSRTNLEFVAESTSNLLVTRPSSSNSLTFLDKPGVTSGTIEFTFTQPAIFRVTASFTVWLTLFDAAGNPSNTVSATVSTWFI